MTVDDCNPAYSLKEAATLLIDHRQQHSEVQDQA
jgi:hypothetical protein